VEVHPPLVVDVQATETIQPREHPFHHPSLLSQPLASMPRLAIRGRMPRARSARRQRGWSRLPSTRGLRPLASKGMRSTPAFTPVDHVREPWARRNGTGTRQATWPPIKPSRVIPSPRHRRSPASGARRSWRPTWRSAGDRHRWSRRPAPRPRRPQRDGDTAPRGPIREEVEALVAGLGRDNRQNLLLVEGD
jgi:hypothetical protein